MFSLRRSKPSTHRLTLEILEDRTLLDATPTNAVAVVMGTGGGGEGPPGFRKIPSPIVAIDAVKGDILSLGLKKPEQHYLFRKADAAFKAYTDEKLTQAENDLTHILETLQHLVDRGKLPATKAAAVMTDTQFAKASFYDGITAQKVKSSAEVQTLDTLYSDLVFLESHLKFNQFNKLEDEIIREIKLVLKDTDTLALKESATMKKQIIQYAKSDSLLADEVQALLADLISLRQSIKNPLGGGGGPGGLPGTGTTTVGTIGNTATT